MARLPLMLTVEQAREVLGIGRSLAYGEVRRYLATDGREGIPAVRIGSAIRIPRAGLVDLMLAAPAPEVSSPVDAARRRPGPVASTIRRARRSRALARRDRATWRSCPSLSRPGADRPCPVRLGRPSGVHGQTGARARVGVVGDGSCDDVEGSVGGRLLRGAAALLLPAGRRTPRRLARPGRRAARSGRRGGRRGVPGGDGRDGPPPPGPASGSPLRRHLGAGLRRHLLGAEVGVGPVGPRRRAGPR